MRLSVEEVPATPAMASTLMVIHILQRSVLRRPETETCAVRSAHASREVLDRSLSCGRSVDAIGAPRRLRCQLPHIGASGAPAASNEACWCATAWRTGQRKPTVRETPFFHTVRRIVGFSGLFSATASLSATLATLPIISAASSRAADLDFFGLGMPTVFLRFPKPCHTFAGWWLTRALIGLHSAEGNASLLCTMQADRAYHHT